MEVVPRTGFYKYCENNFKTLQNINIFELLLTTWLNHKVKPTG
jgi:hypothetical protein